MMRILHRGLPILILGLLLFSAANAQYTISLKENRIGEIKEGGTPQFWVISNSFPTEIDAGMWENFNRFNLESLPRKDWLAPFGGISRISLGEGTLTADTSLTVVTESTITNPVLRADLPEVGAVSEAKQLPDAKEMSWKLHTVVDSVIDFFNLGGSKTIGTGYAAALLSTESEIDRVVETNGFLGAIWLNGKKIYDGYSLNPKTAVKVRLNKGINRLIVRASGISGDYWRKNGGWVAGLRIWSSETFAENAKAFSGSSDGKVFYLEGFHVDPVYLQDQRGYSKLTLSNMSQYVQSLKADPSFGAYLSEIDYLKPYLDTHPEDRDFLKKAVADGRVGSGGAYNQPNPMNTGGESFIRNILYGQAMHRSILGRESKSLALWDVFGHIPQLSQIVNKSGFTGVTWSKKISGFQPFFYDFALDGSKAIHRRVDYAYSFSGFGSGKNYGLDSFKTMTSRKFEETRSLGSTVDLRINAADFTPPWTNMAGNSEALRKNIPEIVVTGQAQDRYFDELRKEITAGRVRMPVTSRDKLFFHVGVMMARSDLKVAHRLTENTLLNAERFATLAYLNGAPYPDLALDKAWRQIFFNSHHDAITGTPSDSAMVDLVHGYREVFELSKQTLDTSLNFITRKIDRTPKFTLSDKKSVSLVVFNPMNWMRTDVVRTTVSFGGSVTNLRIRALNGVNVPYRVIKWDPLNPEIEFVAGEVPSLGYKTFYVESVQGKRRDISSGSVAVENEFYRVTVDASRGGAITSIWDKVAEREVINTRDGRYGNEIAVLKEELTKKNVTYPAWELWTTGEKQFSSSNKASVTEVIDGPTKEYIVEGTLPNSVKYRQTISLRDGVKRIDFKTELVDYKGKDELFTVNFPLNVSNGSFVTEDRFGAVTRNTSKGFLDYRTNTDKLVSGAPVYGVYNWAYFGPSEVLRFTDGGKTVGSIPLKTTALIQPHGEKYLRDSEILIGSMIRRGISITPFFDDNDFERRKDLSIEDSMMPKSLNEDIAHHGMRISLGGKTDNLYSAKILNSVTKETVDAFEKRLGRDGYAFLVAYDKDVPNGWKAIPVILIAGDFEKALFDLSDGELSSEGFAKETLGNDPIPWVPDYGVALINKGTPGMSLENPNTLTMLLTHTAMFPGVNLPFEFVPEHKTHVFEYSLMPNRSDWKKADVTHAGYDFNNPLLSVQAPISSGELPAVGSLLEMSGESVLSALKLSGEPLANFRDASERRLVARVYEPEGAPTSVSFKSGNTIESYTEADLLERPLAEFKTVGGEIKSGVSGFEIKTLMFGLKQNFKSRTPEPLFEMVQPVFSRYWLHNGGAAPVGNDGVKVSLRAVEQMGSLSSFSWNDPYNQGGITTSAVRVQVVNNYNDRTIKGKVRLSVPGDWRIVPDVLDYEIAPGRDFVKDVVVVTYPVKKNDDWERASGLVKAFIEHDGQTFYDVLQIGKPFTLNWEVKAEGGNLKVRISNPNRQEIEGAIALVGPYETWLLQKSQAPRELPFKVGARGEIILTFPGETSNAAWQVARLAFNGNVEYRQIAR